MQKLQKILIPIDFSPTAANAVRYANGIFEKHQAEVALVYINMPEYPITEDEISLRYEKFKKEVLHEVKFSYDFHVWYGNLLNELVSAVKGQQADLVIMGSKGKRETDVSLASALIRAVECPVIVVPDHYSQYRIRKIAFANDYKPIQESEAIRPLWEFALEFGAKVFLLHLSNTKKHQLVLADDAESTLEYYLENLDHEYVYLKNDDFQQAINEYIETNKIDLLVILSRDHGRNQMKSEGRLITLLTDHAQVPVLALC